MDIASSVSQATRTGKFHSPLGGDTLVLTGFAGDEGINHLGQFRVDAMSVNAPADLDACLGRGATVEIRSLAHGPRFFDGVVAEAELLGTVDNQDGLRCWNYRFTLRPWFWLAGLRRNQRIFHNRTAPQIIAEVLADYSDFTSEQRLTGSYEPLEYTVQYRETDLAFVSRMAERFGISWHFEHQMGKHVMVLADNADAYPAAPGGSRPYRPSKGHHQRPEEHFNRWRAGRKVTTGRLTLTDYNFKTPDAAMMAEQSADNPYAQGAIESFDFPGGYLAQGPGTAEARLGTDRESGADGWQSADGDCVSLAPGMVVSVTEHPDGSVSGPAWLLARADHHYDGETYRSGRSGRSAEEYRGHFGLFPAARPFTPARATPAAVMPGPQTAMVVGEGEIDCDEYGRILVKFHWDRHSAHSMRCRVSQSWAGAGWGGMVIPRIGMEVVVEFLEGDPDQPLVTGCVYNGRQTVPYALPAHKTRSTFRTDTHQGEGFNELRFEDQAGEEEIFIHAQKDRNEKTLHNHTERIDNNWVQSVGHNKSVEVTNNHVEAIGGNMSISVGPASIGQVVNQGLLGLSQGISDVASALGLPGFLNPGEGNMSMFIEKARAETIGTISATTVGIANMLTVGVSSDTTVGKAMSVTVGDRATERVGKSKSVDVGDVFTLTVGASKLEMRKDGTITLSGKKILVKGDTSVRIKGTQIDEN